jgi:hypothetical protein
VTINRELDMKQRSVARPIKLLAFFTFVLLIGCDNRKIPNNYEDCMWEASNRPTVQGVRTARDICRDKFGKDNRQGGPTDDR